jgi:hypothetical protein
MGQLNSTCIAKKKWVFHSPTEFGLRFGSRCRHSRMNSDASGDRKSGMTGSSLELAILKMACTCPLHSLHGGLPVAISSTVHPTDQMSAATPWCSGTS